MKKGLIVAGFASIVLVLLSCFGTTPKAPLTNAVELYKNDLQELKKSIEELAGAVEKNTTTGALQAAFKKARERYKQVEWLAAYYHEFTATQINGPDIEEVEPEDKNVVLKPEGFQVIEGLLFPAFDTANKSELLQQIRMLKSSVGRLTLMAGTMETTDAHVFDAARLQLFRIISLGISGFDSPLAKNSIAEAKASLNGLNEFFSLYAPALQKKDRKISDEINRLFTSVGQYLNQHTDFNGLDRMELITTYLNPLSAILFTAQAILNVPFLTEPRALRASAPTLFSPNIFDADFYKPDAAAASSEAKRLLGEKLFYDAVLSDNGKRSCASCHQPQKAFSDGLKQNLALNSRTPLKRNTPTLLYAALQPAQFYDMRVSFLEDQAAEVINSRDEMHGSFAKAKTGLQPHPVYAKLFRQAFHSDTISESQIKNALASYIRSLTPFQSRFDAYMQGMQREMNTEEIKGFNLFMGKAKCGTCHFAPLFNGVNPPQFTKMDAEIIGVPATNDTASAQLDKDKGKFEAYRISIQRYAFKTPTLRNVERTAPYMHNGVFQTLEAVVDFYNRGGGASLGIALPQQTLPPERLNLSANEKKAIVAFLKTLTDNP